MDRTHPPTRRRLLRTLAGVTAAAAGVAAGGYFAWHRREYPFGSSHCCEILLMNALKDYAEAHDGWFPRGEATPEASLGLLHRFNPKLADANLLRGKSVPESVVRARLERGELLTPETCGWHCVEGLRYDPARGSETALFWDKVGLGHNGQRLPPGSHTVWFANGGSRLVPGEEWEAFVAGGRRPTPGQRGEMPGSE